LQRNDPTEADDARVIAARLSDIERTRDLTRAFFDRAAAGSPAARTVQAFVAELAAEMHDFRAIVDAAIASAARNAVQLHQIAAGTEDQRATVERAASAVGELDTGARHVAETADALRRMTADVVEATSVYDGGIDEILDDLTSLTRTIASAREDALAIDGGAKGVAAFLARLHAIARQARLLGINAAIEAAHLGDVGTGFTIVASEIKKLASSTSESAAGVGRIEHALTTSGKAVGSAIDDADANARSLADDVAAAQRRSTASRTQLDALAQTIADVADAANAQSAMLTAIADDVARSAAFANGIRDAAERAANLDLHGSLDRLAATIARYTLDEDAGRREHVASGAAQVPLPAEVAAAVAALRARVDADQRELLTAINALSVAIARNTYEWRGIAASLDGLRGRFQAIDAAMGTTAEESKRTAAASHRMRAALELARSGFATTVDDLEHSLEAVVRIHDTVRRADTFVATAGEASSHAETILTLIDAISAETALLSLNAAIEAAHAGDAGSGFGVIASEIRRLAVSTLEATQQISGVLETVAAAGGGLSTTTALAVAQTRTIDERTSGIRSAVVALRARLERTLQDAAAVAAVVEQQFVAIGDVRAAAAFALQRIDTDVRALADDCRLDLANLGMEAHALAARRPLGITAEAVRAIGLATAEAMDAVFDEAIAARRITLDDCFDTEYREITGAAIAELGRLFDVSRVPAEGFLPKKFATRYDRFVEDGIDALIDTNVPRHPAIKAMFAVDLNGYCFGHYRECRQAWSGDYATDLAANRIKRFFEDEVSLRCSRNGLGQAANGLPPRTPRATFAARGCTLARNGDRPWAIFTYARDTGVVYNDLSVGIFARNERVGTIRVIYDADAV
jgi:methyl-accepting chemotaxis protein